MNRIVSALLAIVVFMGVVPITASAAGNTPLGYSMTGTVQNGGGTPQGPQSGAIIDKGKTFDVAFDRSAFNWSPTGNGYDFTGIQNSWVKVEVAQSPMPFEVVDLIPNTSTGGATARIKATGAYSGAVRVYLQGGVPGGATNAWNGNITVNTGIAKIVRTKAGGTQPSWTSHTGDTVTVNAGDVIRFAVPFDNFEWDPADGDKTAGSITDTSWIKLTGAKVGTDFQAAYEPTSGGAIRVALTAVRQGTYTMSLNLQGNGGAATTSSAARKVTVNTVNSGKINGIASDARLGGTHSGALLNGRTLTYNELGNLEVKAGDDLLLPLTAGFFTWDGTAPYAASPVTRAQLRSGKVDVSTSSRSGTKAFRDSKPELYQDGGTTYVRVRFVEEFVATKDLDFSMMIYLTVDGRRNDGSGVEIAGTLVQDVYELYGDDAEFDLSYGGVVEAAEYIRGARLYLGEGVTVHANLSTGRKYSGIAKSDPTAEDERVMDKYKAIELAITLETVNLDRSSSTVTFDHPGDYYVYDSSLAYLGRSSERLPFSRKYYFATEKLDVSDSVDGANDEPVYEVPSNPVPAANNANINPGTGR